MSGDTREASKRVPKSLDGGTPLVGSYTVTDLLVAALPAVFVVLGMQLFVPPDTTVAGARVREFTLPLGAVGVALGAVGVYLTPDHRATDEWLATMLEYRQRPSQQSHATASDHTQVERVYPRADAIERADGALVGVVRVEPPSMALATDAEWRQQAAASTTRSSSTPRLARSTSTPISHISRTGSPTRTCAPTSDWNG